jgi:hypothetical protein
MEKPWWQSFLPWRKDQPKESVQQGRTPAESVPQEAVTATSPPEDSSNPQLAKNLCRFSELDYLYRLAQEVITLLARGLDLDKDNAAAQTQEGKAQLRAAETVRELLAEHEIPINLRDPQELAHRLRNRPKLQEHLSYPVNYTPSRWLVEREIEEIRKLRVSRHHLTKGDGNSVAQPYAWMFDNEVRGICFSGGGIRSATFNLGILQALAKFRDKEGLSYLERFDYLSSVSGGGYIHEWLAAWIKRVGLETVKEKLVPPPEEGCALFHSAPVKWLRRYSNYLTPRKGLFSSDTWVMVSVWLRNTFLNQVVLVSLLLFLLLVSQLVAPGSSCGNATFKSLCTPAAAQSASTVGSRVASALHLKDLHDRVAGLLTVMRHFAESRAIGVWGIAAVGLFLIGLLLMVISLRAAKKYVIEEKNEKRRKMPRGGGKGRAIAVVGLFLLSAVAVSQLVFLLDDGLSYVYLGVFLCLLLQCVLIVLAGGAVAAFEFLNKARFSELPTLWEKIKAVAQTYGGLVSLFSVVSTTAGTVVFGLVCWVLRSGLLPANCKWRVMIVCGPPLFLGVPFFSQVVLAGLIGRDFSDSLREWLAGVRAWSLLLGCAWFVWFGIALCGPTVVTALLQSKWAATIKWSAVAGWILTTAGSVLAGKSSKTNGSREASSKSALALNLLALAGPYVFIVGLLLTLSFAAEYAASAWPSDWRALLLYLIPLAVFLLFGWRVDINEFSMHAFYRNRLSRCYLGATNVHRRPNPLTGLDEWDTKGLNLSRFSRTRPPKPRKEEEPQEGPYEGPFPIFCATLNLTFGEDLAWQERKAASFMFTPLYSGYHVGWTAGSSKEKRLSFNGYVPTNCYAYPDGGINIATAIAISGAAVSPNWGYHSNPATAFLMTMFNVRLGWWLTNPRMSNFAGCGRPTTPDDFDPSQRPSPAFPALQLTREMLGQTDDTSKFVYLSDGGHFENMGLYELVRRRCRYIVVCDSEEDANYRFEGIGTAIQRCRVDFGVEIELDLAPLRSQMDTRLGYPISKQHFQVGRVRYPERSNERDQGVILYIKSSLTGATPSYKDSGNQEPKLGEPGDIVNHKLSHEVFPHDSTANQWFDEQTFESYRRLGFHIAEEIARFDVWKEVIP